MLRPHVRKGKLKSTEERFADTWQYSRKMKLLGHGGSDGFTHRPWPWAPRFLSPAQLLSLRLIIDLRFAKLWRGITSQCTLKRAKMQTCLDSYQPSNNTIILFATQYKIDNAVFHRSSAVSASLSLSRAFCRRKIWASCALSKYSRHSTGVIHLKPLVGKFDIGQSINYSHQGIPCIYSVHLGVLGHVFFICFCFSAWDHGRRKGWQGGWGPMGFEIWHFPMIFLGKKVVLWVSSR